MKDNEEKEFKATDTVFRREIASDLEENLEKFKDPVVLGEMMYRLLEERENTNRILKTILQRLDTLEAKGMPLEHVIEEVPLLAEIDQEILDFVKGSGKATAENVRERFNYRGKNAASSRLNRLCSKSLLFKKQVGKKVFFFPK